MKCEKTALLRHLSVQNPATLAEEPWHSHVAACSACREEWGAFAWSLAVYKRIEQDHASRLNVQPGWKAFARHLARQEAAQRRAHAFAGPWLAGIMGLILVGGIVSWGVWSENGDPLLPSFTAEDASPLSVSNSAPKVASRRVPARMLTTVSTAGPQFRYSAGGGYRNVPEWRRLPRSAAFLEGQGLALDRPSGELVFMPFDHQRTQNPNLVPIPTSEARMGVPYGIAAPVR